MEEIELNEESKYLFQSWKRNHLLSIIISGFALVSMYIYFQHFLNDAQVLLVLLGEVALAWFLHYRATQSREKLMALILEAFEIDVNDTHAK